MRFIAHRMKGNFVVRKKRDEICDSLSSSQQLRHQNIGRRQRGEKIWESHICIRDSRLPISFSRRRKGFFFFFFAYDASIAERENYTTGCFPKKTPHLLLSMGRRRRKGGSTHTHIKKIGGRAQLCQRREEMRCQKIASG